MTWDNCEPTLGRVYSSKLQEVFGAPREYRSELLPIHYDLAASVQARLEECYFELLNFVHARTRQRAVLWVRTTRRFCPISSRCTPIRPGQHMDGI